jgi:hypothetical protein
MDIIGKVLIQYIKDRVMVEKRTADCLFYGAGGMGKTFAGAVPFADELDPTFEKNWQERFIFGDQIDKYNAFLRTPDSETLGKAYIQDELGVAAYSEEHGKKEVRNRVKTGQMRRRKYAFRISTLTDIDRLTSAIRHQQDFIFKAIDKNTKYKFTTYQCWEVQQEERYNSYGEKFTIYSERPIVPPTEYWVGTQYEGHTPHITKIDVGLVRRSLEEKIEPILNQWKEDYDRRQAEENEKIKKNKDVYENIAREIINVWDSYALPTSQGGYELNRVKIADDFKLSRLETSHVVKRISNLRLAAGFKK